MSIRKSKVFLSSLLVLVLLALTACSGSGSKAESTTFKCGSQGYAEVEIQCEIVKGLIEGNTPHKVEHVTRLGSSMAALNAVKSDDLQIMIGFVGTLMLGLYEKDVTRELYDPDKAWSFVRDKMATDHKVHVFKPYGYNNTYALVMRKDKVQQLGIKNTSDLAKHAPNLTLGTDTTWQNYPGQGYKEWKELYGFGFKKTPEMEYGIMYRAVDKGDVDAVMAYSTDGRIKSLNLTVIEDDKQFNPPYHGVLMMRSDLQEKYPDVYALLTKLEGKTTTEEMTALNAEVDVNEKEPDKVAMEWLKQKGLIK